MLTPLLLTAALTAQLVEVPLHRFRTFAEPRVIAAAALSPDAHTVSLWTRWSPETPCTRWTVDVQTGATEGFGEDACPLPPLPPQVRCEASGCRLERKGQPSPLGEVALQGVPTRAQLAAHRLKPVAALNFDGALTFVSLVDGKLLSSFGHAGFALRGLAASEAVEWLLWVQGRDGADHLYLADGDELLAPPAQRPFVRSVPRLRMPSSFGWKKDTRSTPGSVCEFFERGVMVEDDVLLLDWSEDAKPFDLRVRGQGGQLQKWRVDVASATPVAGLQVERVHFPKQARWRLKIRFPFPLEALAMAEGGAKIARLRPIERPMSTTSSEPACLFTDGELQPERLLLDALLR